MKNVTEGGKTFKTLIRFHSANKINNDGAGGKKEKYPKKSIEQVKT